MKKVMREKVTKEAVLAALRAGPLRNIEIRAAIFGAGNEERADPAGCGTTEALQSLKKDHQVALHGVRWGLRSHQTCAACHGRGFVTRKTR